MRVNAEKIKTLKTNALVGDYKCMDNAKINVMKYSVLLSVYYKENPTFLKQSLDSIFNQKLKPNEFVLVKDGKLPIELDTLIENYASRYIDIVKIVVLSENMGLGKALNEGLKYCSYDLVARMDTDDVAKADRFEKQLAVFDKYIDVDLVGAWIDEFEDNISNVKSIRKLPQSHEEIVKYAKRRNPINHPVVMFRKDAVLAAGGYLHFPLFEDYYLWVRMLMNGSKFYNIQESLLYFRFSPDMFKRRGGWKYALNEFHFQYYMWNIGFISFFTFIKNIFVRFVARMLPNFLRSILYKKMLRK